MPEFVTIELGTRQYELKIMSFLENVIILLYQARLILATVPFYLKNPFLSAVNPVKAVFACIPISYVFRI